ncbi:hypothetical protein Salat_2716100 [Sesamum alatum]|uniref:Uncharacterized protein n=1 Tax=Sesamum alatum TaxID=300844 RepID=A0AAE2CBJ7_9LAMI|nr:hypothetical protein Salat_2716100 [Sesamum alatum]
MAALLAPLGVRQRMERMTRITYCRGGDSQSLQTFARLNARCSARYGTGGARTMSSTIKALVEKATSPMRTEAYGVSHSLLVMQPQALSTPRFSLVGAPTLLRAGNSEQGVVNMVQGADLAPWGEDFFVGTVRQP